MRSVHEFLIKLLNKLLKRKKFLSSSSLLIDIETNDNNKFAYIFYEFGLNNMRLLWMCSRRCLGNEGLPTLLLCIIFWPSKIKILCLLRLSDFYDNHQFMQFVFLGFFTVKHGRGSRKYNKFMLCMLHSCDWKWVNVSTENLLIIKSRKETIE